MKFIKVSAIVIVFIGVLSACTQKTCPTYAQEDASKEIEADIRG